MKIPDSVRRVFETGSGRATLAFGGIFGLWLVWELVGDAPVTLNTLVGGTGGIWFGIIANQQAKREAAVAEKADRASARSKSAQSEARNATRRADEAEDRADDAENRADDAERRAGEHD